MAVTVQQVLQILKEFAPPELACSWDNVGLLVDAGRPVNAVAVALDITADVVKEAAESGCDLIVSHHPVIFNPIKRMAADDVPALLIKNGISAICMHTNLDATAGGVNDTLAGILGMTDTQSFAEGCGRIGNVKPTTAAALAKLCAERLGAHPQFVETDRPVTRLAEVSGGGGSYLQEAIDLGADCFVTGEAAHHIALLAHQKGVGLVVAGHWATEHPVTRVLAEHLAANLPDEVRITLTLSDTDPFTYL
nr:Nif3-like dinuclear metal center hexameric protein [uncultured Gemmiger sp.]